MLGGVIIGSQSEIVGELLKWEVSERFARKAAVACDTETMSSLIKDTYPVLVLMEHCFAGVLTGEYIINLLQLYSTLRIAVWSAAPLTPVVAARFIHAGAESIFSLGGEENDLLKILNSVISGKRYMPLDVQTILDSEELAYEGNGKATPRECEIIRHTIIEGLPEKEIAKVMGITLRTVKMHKSNVFDKCNGRSIVHLLHYAVRHGIVGFTDFGIREGA